MSSLKHTLKWAQIGVATTLIKKVNEGWAQNYLKNQLQEMPGLPAKFGQFLNQRWVSASSQDAPKSTFKMELSEIKKIISDESPRLADKIESISEESWSASIGQVHRVHLVSGEVFAVKVQYPHIADELSSQIDALLWLMKKSPAAQYGIDMNAYQRDFHTFLGREIDYLQEADNQNFFYQSFQGSDYCLIPQVYLEYTTKKILVQDFIEAVSLPDLKNEGEEVRRQSATLLSSFILESLFKHQRLHTDLQSKNWGWSRKHNKLVVYDFGSWIGLENKYGLLIETLINSVREKNGQYPFDILVGLGFDEHKLVHLMDRLPALLEMLFEMFVMQGQFFVKDWKLSEKTQVLLGEQAWWFRSAGPPWFLWMMRSLSGAFLAMNDLDVGLQMKKLYDSLIDELPGDRFQDFVIESRNGFLKEQGLKNKSFADQAKNLRIRVMEGHEEIVALAMPANVVFELENIVGADIKEKIEHAGYNLEELKINSLKSGLSPQIIVDFNDGLRHYYVALE